MSTLNSSAIRNRIKYVYITYKHNNKTIKTEKKGPSNTQEKLYEIVNKSKKNN